MGLIQRTLYNALGQRIKTIVDLDGAGSGAAVTTYFTFAEDQIALEFSLNGSTATPTHRYLYAPGTDQVLADQTFGLATRWALSDQEGSVRDVFYIFNAGGANYPSTIEYNAFGEVTNVRTEEPGFAFRFLNAGREYDTETGFYYNRARTYDPATGRFLSQDPSGLGDGPNPYLYVHNNPLTNTDPSGLCADLLYGTTTSITLQGNLVNYSPSNASNSLKLDTTPTYGPNLFPSSGSSITGATASPHYLSYYAGANPNYTNSSGADVTQSTNAYQQRSPDVLAGLVKTNQGNNFQDSYRLPDGRIQVVNYAWDPDASLHRIADSKVAPNLQAARGIPLAPVAQVNSFPNPLKYAYTGQFYATDTRYEAATWGGGEAYRENGAAFHQALAKVQSVDPTYLSQGVNLTLSHLEGEALRAEFVANANQAPQNNAQRTMWWIGTGTAAAVTVVQAGQQIQTIRNNMTAQRNSAENAKERNKYKNHKDAAREGYEQRTGNKWPKDETGAPWPGEHTPPLKEGGDPMIVTPRNPGAPDPHNIPGPDGLTDYQRWGALGTPAREANKR